MNIITNHYIKIIIKINTIHKEIALMGNAAIIRIFTDNTINAR